MRASLRPNCSTSWPPNPLHRQGQLPLHDRLSKICDKTLIEDLGRAAADYIDPKTAPPGCLYLQGVECHARYGVLSALGAAEARRHAPTVFLYGTFLAYTRHDTVWDARACVAP
jgi:hypothetical protein